MGQQKSNYQAVLALECILEEHTDRAHPLSVKQLKDRLEKDYGIEASEDFIGKRLQDILDFYGPESTTRPAASSPDSRETPLRDSKAFAACRQTDDEGGEPSGRRRGFYMSERPLDDSEIDFAVVTIDSAGFLKSGRRNDLATRLRMMQSPTARCRHGEETRGPSFIREVKPGFDEFLGTICRLNDAILEKKAIDFTHLHYDYEETTRSRKGASSGKARASKSGRWHGSQQKGRSPYALRCVGGRYYLLTNGERQDDDQDDLRVFRVDLIGDLRISDSPTDRNAYRPPSDPEAIEDYFATAVEGFGGHRSGIEVRCDSRAFHYLVSNFGDYPGFTTRKDGEGGKLNLVVSFEADEVGFRFWAQKFLSKIEIVKPAGLREKAMRSIRDNAYGLAVEEPRRSSD